METREQKRAGFALKRVKRVREVACRLSAENRTALLAKYRTALLDLPSSLHSIGLGHTVALCLARAGRGKGKQHHKDIYEWLEEWLKGKNGPYHEADENQRLLECITDDGDDTVAKYRRASVEARALSVWLKRFAEAFLDAGGS